LLLSVTAVALLVLLLSSSSSPSGMPVGESGAGVLVSHVATSPPNPFVNGMSASIAIGQPNLTWDSFSGTPNASNIVPNPESPCMNPAGDLFVPNVDGGRITEYLAPLTTNESAAVVIGQENLSAMYQGTNQSSFYTPAACAFDGHGDLWAPDFLSNRILEFKPPFYTGMNASLVLGQDNFNTSVEGLNQSALRGPADVAFDPSGNLWVSDVFHNRVLEFRPPFHTGMNASLVLGQSNFNTSASGVSSTNFTGPEELTYANGVLWVADLNNNRVLGFSAPLSTGEGATYELGQSNFSVSTTVGPTALAHPYGVSVDGRGDLWVSDAGNNRVLEYLPPFSSNESPSLVLGQQSFEQKGYGVGAANLSMPLGAWVGPTGALWVADGENDRVLGYLPATYSVGFTASGLPTGTPWSITLDDVTELGSASGVSLQEENGSYNWNVTPVDGYAVSADVGSLIVNGSGVSVALDFTQVTYSVEFKAGGLPATTEWTVTLDGVAHASTGGAPISIPEPNGSFAYTVTGVSGYNDTPATGTVTVAGEPQEVGIAFFATPAASPPPASASGSPGGIALGLALLLAVGALVVGVVVGLLVGRRRGGGASPPSPASGPMSAGPPTSSGPTSDPVAPWSESGALPPPSRPGGPPPGAT
jgi:hypothetical protein